MRPDYYNILAIDRDADELTLKCAYYKLAAEYHPDRNQGSAEAEQKFKEVAEAYGILSDPSQRAAYDGGSGVALERLIVVPSLNRTESRRPHLRIVPYAIAIATAAILWVGVTGLARFLASNTTRAVVVAAKAPDIIPAEPTDRSQPAPFAPTRTAPAKRAAAPAGIVTIVRGARPVTQTQIPYSSDALRERVSGLVEVELTIAADGSVQNPQILSGHPLLTRDVAETVSQWTFQSMRVNGRPVPRTTGMTLRFDIVR